MQRNSVLLPQPLGPMMQTTSPESISRCTSLTAAMRPNDLDTPATVTTGLSATAQRPAGGAISRRAESDAIRRRANG